MKPWTTLLLVLLSHWHVSGQSSQIDSLKNVLEHTTNELTKTNILNRMAYDGFHLNPDSTKIWAQAALQLAIKNKDIQNIAKAHRYIGIVEDTKGNYTSAINHFEKTIEHASQIGDSALMGRTYKNFAITNRKKATYKEAFLYALKAIDMLADIQDTTLWSNAILDLAVLYKVVGDHPNALKNYQKALSIKSLQNDEVGQARIYQGLGTLYLDMKDFEQSLVYLQKSLRIKENYNNTSSTLITKGNVGLLLHELGRYDEALIVLEETLEGKEAIGLNCSGTYQLRTIGDVYMQTGQLTLAKTYLNRAIQSAKNCNQVRSLIESHITLAQLYRQTNQPALEESTLKTALNYSGALPEKLKVIEALTHFHHHAKNYQQAFDFKSKYIDLRNSIFNIENARKLAILEAEYSFEKEKQQLKQSQVRRELELKSQVVKERWLGIMGSLFLMLVLSVTYYILKQKQKTYKALRQKNELIENQNIKIAKAAETEKKLLTQQIQGKDRELALYAMQFNERNNTLLKLEDKLSELESDVSSQRDIQVVRKLVQSNLNEKEAWSNFINKFEDVYPNFFEKIKLSYETLTLNQLKICAYIKVGMDNRDIAEITHTEIASVKKNVNRMKKKMQLGPEDSIRDFLIGYN